MTKLLDITAMPMYDGYMNNRLKERIVSSKAGERFTLEDFKSGDHYFDSDGLWISKEQAQIEVDFLNRQMEIL